MTTIWQNGKDFVRLIIIVMILLGFYWLSMLPLSLWFPDQALLPEWVKQRSLYLLALTFGPWLLFAAIGLAAVITFIKVIWNAA